MRSLNLGLDMYYFVKSNARSNNRYKQDKIIRMLDFFYQQLICPYFSFICVVLISSVQCCLCLWIYHSWFPLWLSLIGNVTIIKNT